MLSKKVFSKVMYRLRVGRRVFLNFSACGSLNPNQTLSGGVNVQYILSVRDMGPTDGYFSQKARMSIF